MNDRGARRSARPRRGPIRRFAGWWLSGWWHTPRRAFFGPEGRAIVTEAKQLMTQLRDDLLAQQRVRGVSARDLTYAQMLAAWGIAPREVASVTRMLRIARWKVVGVMAMTAGALLWQLTHEGFGSGLYLFVTIACIASLGLCLLVISWRLRCLTIRRYEKFSSWLALQLWISRPAQ